MTNIKVDGYRLKTVMEGQEKRYWDSWNTQRRSGVLERSSIPGQLGTVILREVASLGLEEPRIVEIGCGTGWLAEQLAGHSSYLGLDLSPKAIEEARARVPGARFSAADIHDWDVQDERFDLALMVDAISCFRDQDLAVRKVFQMVEPGGYLVLSTVNPFVYSRISWVGAPGEGQVRKWLTRSALHVLLERGGFQIVRSCTVMPAGDRGILRIFNARKLNRLVQFLIPETAIRRTKEFFGLGQYRIVVARRVNKPGA